MQIKNRRRKVPLAASTDPLFSHELEAESIIAKEATVVEQLHCLALKAGLHATNGEINQALSYYGKAVAIEPLNVKILEEYAQVLLEKGDYYAAITTAQRAAGTSDGAQCPFVFLTLGRSQFNYGELDLAQVSFEKALNLFELHNPNNKEIAHAERDLKHVKELIFKQSG